MSLDILFEVYLAVDGTYVHTFGENTERLKLGTILRSCLH